MIRDTGSPRADAEADFLRARRLQVITALASRLAAQGQRATARPCRSRRSSTRWAGSTRSPSGIRVIPVDQIVGSVDRVRDFDPQFRPRSGRSRQRWERIAEAARAGRVPAAHRRLPDRRHLLRPRRAPPRVGAPGARAADDRGRRAAGAHRRRARRRAARAPTWRARELRRLFLQRVPLGRPARRGDRAQRRGAVPLARRDGRGLGRPADVRRGRGASNRTRGRAALVRRGVRAGRRDDRRGRPAWRRARPPPTPTCASRASATAIFHDHTWNTEVIAELGRRR